MLSFALEYPCKLSERREGTRYIDNPLYDYKPKLGYSGLDILQDVLGNPPYIIDDFLFAQLISSVIYGTSGFRRYNSDFWKVKSRRMILLANRDKETREKLTKIKSIYTDLWLVENDIFYIGLTPEGPVMKQLTDWISYLKEGIANCPDIKEEGIEIEFFSSYVLFRSQNDLDTTGSHNYYGNFYTTLLKLSPSFQSFTTHNLGRTFALPIITTSQWSSKLEQLRSKPLRYTQPSHYPIYRSLYLPIGFHLPLNIKYYNPLSGLDLTRFVRGNVNFQFIYGMETKEGRTALVVKSVKVGDLLLPTDTLEITNLHDRVEIKMNPAYWMLIKSLSIDHVITE